MIFIYPHTLAIVTLDTLPQENILVFWAPKESPKSPQETLHIIQCWNGILRSHSKDSD